MRRGPTTPELGSGYGMDCIQSLCRNVAGNQRQNSNCRFKCPTIWSRVHYERKESLCWIVELSHQSWARKRSLNFAEVCSASHLLDIPTNIPTATESSMIFSSTSNCSWPPEVPISGKVSTVSTADFDILPWCRMTSTSLPIAMLAFSFRHPAVSTLHYRQQILENKSRHEIDQSVDKLWLVLLVVLVELVELAHVVCTQLSFSLSRFLSGLELDQGCHQLRIVLALLCVKPALIRNSKKMCPRSCCQHCYKYPGNFRVSCTSGQSPGMWEGSPCSSAGPWSYDPPDEPTSQWGRAKPSGSTERVPRSCGNSFLE